MKKLVALFIVIFCLTSCIKYAITFEEGVSNLIIKPNTNMILEVDSISLELLPLKNSYVTLYKDQEVVVAEVNVFPEEGLDSIQLKLVHNETIQGWFPQRAAVFFFYSTDSISQIIHWIYGIPGYYPFILIGVFLFFCLYQYFKKKPVSLFYITDRQSVYPMLLCILVSVATTLFSTIIHNDPDSWLAYRFNPTLSPFDVPGMLSVFLGCLWLILIFAIAAIDDIFRDSSFGKALLNLLGLIVGCIVCYYFFYYATFYYIGYLLLACFILLFIWNSCKTLNKRYGCGKCGKKMSSKGICPNCGAMNE